MKFVGPRNRFDRSVSRFSLPIRNLIDVYTNPGYVTHGTDRALWALRLPTLEPLQADVARKWLDAIDAAVRSVEAQGNTKGLQEVLALKEDKTIGWRGDDRWDELMRLRVALPSET